MIKIIADSCCSLVEKFTDKNDLYTFEPVIIGVTIDDVDYMDKCENIEYTGQKQFLTSLKNSSSAPRSFAPSPEAFYNAIISDESDIIFIVTLSSELSATYTSAILAKNMYEDEKNDKKIFVIDSKSAVTAQSVVILKIIESIENGITPEDIYNDILGFVDNDLRFYLTLKSLSNLEKNGRIKPSIAKLATLMNMRPICSIVNGELVLVHKPRGDKAYKKLIELIKNDDIDYTTRTLIISNINNIEAANMIKEEVSKFANFKNIIITQNLSYLATMYCEDGGVTLSY